MKLISTISNNCDWSVLSSVAWETRKNAWIFGKTKVGAALLSKNGNVYSGCNIEHKFRSHDIHAEVNAISNMINCGDALINKIIIVADREKFTPCGSCMDWIMQFGENDCEIGFQNVKGGEITIYTSTELMPHYPK